MFRSCGEVEALDGVPGKPRLFLPYIGALDNYGRECDEVAVNDYEGFALAATHAVAS
jgi:cyclohexanone monooxygenase